MKLSERKKLIINRVISCFIDRAEPVSSQFISDTAGLKVSSATIRKEMSELEEMGFLTHPHTSAGRIPTDRGYRFYVDNILRDKRDHNPKTGEEIPDINIDKYNNLSIETVLQMSSEKLAELTKYFSVITAPAVKLSKLRHVELLEISSNDYLLVLITDTGRVFRKNFTMKGVYSTLDLQAAANVINSQYRDMAIHGIDTEQFKISENNVNLVLMIKHIIKIIKGCLRENILYNRVFIRGASEIIQQPEFIELSKIKALFNLIENEYILMRRLLNLVGEDDYIIKIGSEIFDEETDKSTDDLSLVASRYKINDNSIGAIGVIGPKRMDYYRVINILNIFVKDLSVVFSKKA